MRGCMFAFATQRPDIRPCCPRARPPRSRHLKKTRKDEEENRRPPFFILLLDYIKQGNTYKTPRMANSLRGEVIRLYKNLLYLGREYPRGADYFRERLKSAFMKNKDVTDPEQIRKLVARGEYVIKELEALYFLRKYRAIKKRYYEPEN